MPPEVLTSKDTSANAAIDVWAMGVILHVMLTASFPFKGSNESETIKKIVNNKLKFSKVKKISNQCQKLILSMLEKDPGNRISLDSVSQDEWNKIE